LSYKDSSQFSIFRVLGLRHFTVETTERFVVDELSSSFKKRIYKNKNSTFNFNPKKIIKEA
jgi:hypothetical protein